MIEGWKKRQWCDGDRFDCTAAAIYLMGVCEAKRLKALEEGNTRLKKLLPDRMLDAAALRELLGKNGRPPPSAKPSRTSRLRTH
jgi:hypothetical protein